MGGGGEGALEGGVCLLGCVQVWRQGMARSTALPRLTQTSSLVHNESAMVRPTSPPRIEHDKHKLGLACLVWTCGDPSTLGVFGGARIRALEAKLPAKAGRHARCRCSGLLAKEVDPASKLPHCNRRSKHMCNKAESTTKAWPCVV